MISVFDRIKNIVVTSIFSFSHNVLKRLLFQDVSKGVIVWEWVKVALNPNTTNQPISFAGYHKHPENFNSEHRSFEHKLKF